ncbi:DUF6573 family protein [Arthrobacter woluwensis]|uniref:DUF6573 family protein n=1 Tax=Arthrobacter woluwensis TaxID=156980 RepID=UPI00380EC2BD
MNWKIIHSYSRAQAIADGVLVDVGEAAEKHGFIVPVAMTSACWAEAVAWDQEPYLQDESARLDDVLLLAVLAASRSRVGRTSRLDFVVARVENGLGEMVPTDLELSLVAGPGDAGEPVLTVMLRDED